MLQTKTVNGDTLELLKELISKIKAALQRKVAMRLLFFTPKTTQFFTILSVKNKRVSFLI